MVTFEAEILVHGKTATYFQVPAEAVAALGESKRPPVVVTIGGYVYRGTVAPMGGEFVVPLNRANREAARVAAGDVVTITLEMDTEPRVVAVPADLAEALAADESAAARFDDLSYSHQKEYVDWIEEATRDETRVRRIDRTVEMVKAAKQGR